jgi:hypothetical protein
MIGRQPIFFFNVFVRIIERERNVYVHYLICSCSLSPIYMNMYECALILFTRDLEISSRDIAFFVVLHTSIWLWLVSSIDFFCYNSFFSLFLSLSLTAIVFDHRIVDTYIDSSFLSLSYFRACVVKAITIIPD